MDINAIMRELLDAQKTGAIGKAQELALAVLGWINRGGFAPHGFTVGQARRTAQINLRLARVKGVGRIHATDSGRAIRCR